METMSLYAGFLLAQNIWYCNVLYVVLKVIYLPFVVFFEETAQAGYNILNCVSATISQL